MYESQPSVTVRYKAAGGVGGDRHSPLARVAVAVVGASGGSGLWTMNNTWMFKNSGRRSSQVYRLGIIGAPSGQRWYHGVEITALFTREMNMTCTLFICVTKFRGSSLVHCQVVS